MKMFVFALIISGLVVVAMFFCLTGRTYAASQTRRVKVPVDGREASQPTGVFDGGIETWELEYSQQDIRERQQEIRDQAAAQAEARQAENAQSGKGIDMNINPPPCPDGSLPTMTLNTVNPTHNGWFCHGRKIVQVPCPEQWQYATPRPGEQPWMDPRGKAL